jgi:hypothetical protein
LLAYPDQSGKVDDPASSIVNDRVLPFSPVGRFPAVNANHCLKVPSPSRHFSGFSEREKDADEGEEADQSTELTRMAPASAGRVIVGADGVKIMTGAGLIRKCPIYGLVCPGPGKAAGRPEEILLRRHPPGQTHPF